MIATAATLFLAFLLYLKPLPWFRIPLALILISNQIFYHIYFRDYPFQYCDFAVFLVILALLQKNLVIRQLAFFFALLGSSQVLITPIINAPFPTYGYFAFYINHSGMLFGALFLAFTTPLHLTIRSVWIAWLATFIYGIFALLANHILDRNFGFLSAKSPNPSLLDFLGPWPYYIIWMALLILVFYFVVFFLWKSLRRHLPLKR